MIFLQPWAAWFLAGVPVIVLLYLLKLKRRPVTVSTLLFWQRLMQENRRRALFQRLRNLFSLLLHLLIFALILGALAKPTFDRRIREGSSLVVVLDTRARMQAVESDGRTRFLRAQELAADLVKQASATREVAVITAGASPEVVAPFSGDENLLRQAVQQIVPTEAAGELSSAIQLAGDLLASRRGDRRIVVLAAPGSTVPEVASTRVEFVAVGEPHDNLAITRFATRPLPNSPQTSEVLLEVRNFGESAASGNLELRYDGTLLDVKPFTLETGGRRLDVFPSVPRPGRTARGWLTARLDTADALALDDIARAILPPPKTRRVLLVSAGNWFLEKLLAADPSISFELIAPEAWQPSFAAKFDAVICDGFVPPEFTVAEPVTNFVFLGKTPFNSGSEPIEQPVLTGTQADHPLLRLIDLQAVTFLRCASLTVPIDPGWKFSAPLSSFDHPLLVAGEQRSSGGVPRRLVAFAFALTESDLPLRVAFPLLIANTLQWLGGDVAEAPIALRAGETLQLAADEKIAPEPAAGGEDRTATPAATEAVFTPLRQGFYQRERAHGSDWIAVNTFAEAESDLRRSAGAESATPANVEHAWTLPIRAAASWPVWRFLALGALALLAAEWSLFHRRRTE